MNLFFYFQPSLVSGEKVGGGGFFFCPRRTFVRLPKQHNTGVRACLSYLFTIFFLRILFLCSVTLVRDAHFFYFYFDGKIFSHRFDDDGG